MARFVSRYHARIVEREQGGTYLDVPEELRRYDDQNFTDKYKRLEWDRPSRTITAHLARDGY